jgi:hypothetical protein
MLCLERLEIVPLFHDEISGQSSVVEVYNYCISRIRHSTRCTECVHPGAIRMIEDTVHTTVSHDIVQSMVIAGS